jgi:hypothetical protein
LSLASEEAACAAYLAKYIWRPYRQRDSLSLSRSPEKSSINPMARPMASRGFDRAEHAGSNKSAIRLTAEKQ